MSSIKPRIRLACAIAALGTVALLASCRGFFVKPTLTSIAVGPATPTIQTGNTDNTVQMFVVGTYNDGSTSAPAVSWSISPSSGVVSITAGGLVTAENAGSVVVTASANQNPSITATQTVNVNLGNITGLKLDSPSGYTISAVNGTTNASVSAQTSNGPVDVTATAQWSTANTSIATVVGGTSPVTITGVAVGTTTITASYLSGGTTYTATANVTVQ